MLAFIIFGTRGVRSTVKEGKFHCPQCNTDKGYKHKKVTQFFTLYFIPLIPLGNKGEYVECQSCRNTFIERVLSIQQPTIDVSPQQEAPEISASEPKIAAATAVAATVAATSSEPILSEKQKAIKKLLIMMILADGKVEDAEIRAFHQVYKEMANDTVADIYKEIDAVRLENKPPRQYLKQVSAFVNEEGKKDILKSSMMIAASDGDIDPSEVRMVEDFGRALEIRPSETKEIIESFKK